MVIAVRVAVLCLLAAWLGWGMDWAGNLYRAWAVLMAIGMTIVFIAVATDCWEHGPAKPAPSWWIGRVATIAEILVLVAAGYAWVAVLLGWCAFVTAVVRRAAFEAKGASDV